MDWSAHVVRFRRRSKSAPPLCLKDIGPYFYLRDAESSDLFMDPIDLAKFSSVTTLIRTHARVLMMVDNTKILKLYPLLVDVSVIVANMNLARTKVPVPEVYDHGYSGNCAYILMERVVEAINVDQYINLMKCAVPRRIGRRVKDIVADLASLGLSHNDLYPRNIMVDRFWGVQSVVDWDNCTSSHVSGEYARMVMADEDEMHDWDYIFLQYASDRFGEILLSVGGDLRRMFHRPPLARFPLGRNIGPA
jgi:hypothetical protein